MSRLHTGLALLALAASGARAADGLEQRGEWRASASALQAAGAGPLAEAARLRPGLVAPAADQALAELEWQARWHGLSAELWLGGRGRAGGHRQTEGRVNELYHAGEAADWAWSLGKKRVGWDVGYGFRPNDVVAQEPRRTLLAVAAEGRPLLMAERFWGADQALSLVWANPQHAGGGQPDPRGAGESALAARFYHRSGPLDAHAFGRWGRHSRASAGLAAAWVASDALALHASWRALQRHDGWQADTAAGSAPVAASPWSLRSGGGTRQYLLGLSWTGLAHQSVLLEAWHDGTAPSNATWSAWRARNLALVQAGRQAGLNPGGRMALAGNLAWQADPLAGPGLRRDQWFARLAWQPAPWQLSLDALYTPADRGLLLTAGLQWQGDRWRVNAAWRQATGPADALLMQLPVRRTAVLALARPF